MPEVGFVVAGVRMVMPFSNDQKIECPNGHAIGQVGKRKVKARGADYYREVPFFDWTQEPEKGAPIFNHKCTVCGAKIAWPWARAATF